MEERVNKGFCVYFQMIVHMSRKDQLKAFAQHKVACLQKMISEEHILTGIKNRLYSIYTLMFPSLW